MAGKKSETPTLASIRKQRGTVLRLADEYGARNVRVFGSVERGEALPDSDIDLLVEWDYSRLPAWGGVGFEQALAELFDRRVEVVSEKWLHPDLRERILAEAVVL